MTPATVLLDQSFLEALLDDESPDHATAGECYARLLDEYERFQIRLRARADHLAAVDRRKYAQLLAPVETIHVARQFRRQAARLGDAYSPDLAVTLVVMRRETIERIATFHTFFDGVDVGVER